MLPWRLFMFRNKPQSHYCMRPLATSLRPVCDHQKGVVAKWLATDPQGALLLATTCDYFLTTLWSPQMGCRNVVTMTSAMWSANDNDNDWFVVCDPSGCIITRAGIEPTSLAFQANVLPLHHEGSLISPSHLYVWLLVWEVSKTTRVRMDVPELVQKHFEPMFITINLSSEPCFGLGWCLRTCVYSWDRQWISRHDHVGWHTLVCCATWCTTLRRILPCDTIKTKWTFIKKIKKGKVCFI